MIFKSKKGETMVWLEKSHKMVSFTNGVADIEGEIAKELTALGYVAENSKGDKVVEVKETKEIVEEPIQPVKPIKPFKQKQAIIQESLIGGEV